MKQRERNPERQQNMRATIFRRVLLLISLAVFVWSTILPHDYGTWFLEVVRGGAFVKLKEYLKTLQVLPVQTMVDQESAAA